MLAFLVSTTPTMHAFWSGDNPLARQIELTQFLKNAPLAGGALVLLAIDTIEWPLAFNVGF